MPASHSRHWRRRLYLGGSAILVVGLLAALLVFLTAARSVEAGAVGYRIENGRPVAITLSQSGRDVRKLEIQGGQANVAAAELVCSYS